MTDINPIFTRESYPDRESWLEGRKSVIGSSGASEASTRMGINPWKSVDTLYDEAIGIKQPKDLSQNTSVQFGIQAESYIRDMFILDMQNFYLVEHHPYDILRRKDKPWMYATLDGELTRYSDYARGGLEIKTGSFRSEKDLKDWKDGMPIHYFAQVCQQLAVTGWDYWIVAARLKRESDNPLDPPDVRWFYRYVDAKDKDVQISIMAIEENADYFHNCVVNRKRPALQLRFN